MLSIDIIESKPFRIDPKTNENVLDLVSQSWIVKGANFSIKNIAIVSDETEMRPDLVSLVYNGSHGSMGSLLKINNISNPLSVFSGELLVVPGEQLKKDLFDQGKQITNQKSKARSFRRELQEKISKISEDRIEYLNSKNISNLSQQPLPPNLLGEGENQIEISDGKLIFGPDIGQCRTKIRKNISAVDIKAKLAQKNIFKR
jgi:hypothetical protein